MAYRIFTARRFQKNYEILFQFSAKRDMTGTMSVSELSIWASNMTFCDILAGTVITARARRPNNRGSIPGRGKIGLFLSS